jgi:hypothetical protein
MVESVIPELISEYPKAKSFQSWAALFFKQNDCFFRIRTFPLCAVILLWLPPGKAVCYLGLFRDHVITSSSNSPYLIICTELLIYLF